MPTQPDLAQLRDAVVAAALHLVATQPGICPLCGERLDHADTCALGKLDDACARYIAVRVMQPQPMEPAA